MIRRRQSNVGVDLETVLGKVKLDDGVILAVQVQRGDLDILDDVIGAGFITVLVEVEAKYMLQKFVIGGY